MISIELLKTRLEGNWVAFDKHGRPVVYRPPKDIGPATLGVRPVTDALKRVDENDEVVGSVDKKSVWAVDVIILNTIVLDRLPDQSFSAEGLIEAVRSVGFTWQISSISGP
ncbi:MAG: hypothetical protein WAL25_03855 [Acidimicrobiia bacterium]